MKHSYSCLPIIIEGTLCYIYEVIINRTFVLDFLDSKLKL